MRRYIHRLTRLLLCALLGNSILCACGAQAAEAGEAPGVSQHAAHHVAHHEPAAMPDCHRDDGAGPGPHAHGQCDDCDAMASLAPDAGKSLAKFAPDTDLRLSVLDMLWPGPAGASVQSPPPDPHRFRRRNTPVSLSDTLLN